MLPPWWVILRSCIIFISWCYFSTYLKIKIAIVMLIFSLFYCCSPFLIRDRELKRREEENWNAGTTSLSALFFSSWNSAVNLATGGGGGGGSSSSGGSSSKDKKQQQRSDNSRHERQGSVSPTASMPATPSVVPLPQNKSGKKQVSKKPGHHQN